MMFPWWMWSIPLGILIALILLVLLLRRLISPISFSDKPIAMGNIIVPELRSVKWKRSSTLTKDLIKTWSEKTIPDWKKEGKVKAPRVLLAKLHAGNDVDEINEYLLSLEPWGKLGSTSWLNPDGDYDFTLVPLTTILFLFGNKQKVLHPESSDHLIDTLLTANGAWPRKYAPRSLRYIFETENHILMTEGSRYLRSKWLFNTGKNVNVAGADLEKMEAWMRGYLSELKKCGFYEFNSDPYSAYTVTALLNLEAFGSRAVSKISRELLDGIFFRYTMGSLNFRRMAPFQRQLKKAGKTSLVSDPITPFMKVYCSLYPKSGKKIEIDGGSEHSLMASILPYRPPDKVVEMVLKRKYHYYVRIGHGKRMTPEIYAGGPGYLLSAGGVNRGMFSRIVSRPITLLLDDDTKDLMDVVHMYGPGINFRKWNNTGVYHNFAVCAGRVFVPDSWKPVTKSKMWRIYKEKGYTIGIYSRPKLGIIAVLNGTPDEVKFALDHLNHEERRLKHTFEYPGGESIGYDVLAPRNRWPIVSVEDQDIDRIFDRWPDINGFIKIKK